MILREPKDNDFFIDLPDVGVFRFGRRTFGDRAKIRADYLRIVQDLGDSDPTLSAYASIIASHKHMCVEAPPGWESIEALDHDKETDKLVFHLYDLIRLKEDTFRSGATAGSPAPGEGSISDVPVLVPGEVQPSSDGSTVSGDDAGGHRG